MTRGEVEAKVLTILNGMTQDWELDTSTGIGPQMGLMQDLAFESVDVVQLAVLLEQNFGQGLPFEKLFMREGDYVDELYVSEVVDFVARHAATDLANATSSTPAST